MLMQVLECNKRLFTFVERDWNRERDDGDTKRFWKGGVGVALYLPDHSQRHFEFSSIPTSPPPHCHSQPEFIKYMQTKRILLIIPWIRF